MKKRLMALLLLTGLLSAALTGCGGGSTEQASEDGQTADGSTEARAQANEIVVGIAQDLDESLDPHLAVAAGTKEVMFNVFEGLVKPTPDGDLVPAVADHYEISEDQTTYTFTLREGVQFHNGDPVEMRDVTYSIERCADDSEGTPLIPALSAISSIQADDTTLTITLDQPDSEFLSYLTLAILPEDYTDQATAPVGTGPFKFVSRTAQDSIVLERFDGYWGTPAQLDKVTFRIIENADSLVMSLQSGAIDMFAHLTSTQAAQLGAKVAQPGGGSLTAFEKACDDALTAYLAAARMVPFGEQTVIGYLYAKELEFTAVRTIFAGRAAGLDGDTIRARLRQTYV